MPKPSISVQHINPFIKACLETFYLMANVKLVPGKPLIISKSQSRYDITGIIGLSGEAKGSINLCLKKKDALSLVSKFVQEKVTRMDEETADAVGELANIIAGYAKKEMTGLKIQISLPIVIMGHNHLTDRPRGMTCFIIPFTSPNGNFDLVVALKNQSINS